MILTINIKLSIKNHLKRNPMNFYNCRIRRSIDEKYWAYMANQQHIIRNDSSKLPIILCVYLSLKLLVICQNFYVHSIATANYSIYWI